jgi:hypothetical protein
MIIGIPMVWHSRLTAFWWLLEYCAIQSFHDRPKNIVSSFLAARWIYETGGPD